MKKFHSGQIIQHHRFAYRGVIFAADDYFKHSDEWYELMANSAPPKDKPWYHVLVDGSHQTTYVAERNLSLCANCEQIDHPLMGTYFRRFDGRSYQLRKDL